MLPLSLPNFAGPTIRTILPGTWHLFIRDMFEFPCLIQSKRNPKGGRVIFIDRVLLNLASLINYLETDPVLIAAVGEINKEIALSSYSPSPGINAKGYHV